MKFNFSERAQSLTSSAIREILKVTENPEIISFAGGIPSPLTFPVPIMQDACNRIFHDGPHAALQYAPTEGFLPLREWIAKRHGAVPEQVLITTGSQQALDLIGKVLIDTGSPVLVESPTYLGALQAFSLFAPRFVTLPCDEISVVPEDISPQAVAGARFAYVMPNFQNPTGRRIPAARRTALVKLMAELEIPIVEDDPYGDLSYRGDALPSLRSMNPDGVIYLGSFSKILAPGLRLGYVIAPDKMIAKLVQAKQAADLHTPGFTQRMAFEALKSDFLDGHIDGIRALYTKQCEAMLTALASHMPEGVSWNSPEGGMFVWLRLPEGADSTHLLQASLDAKNATRVAFVPGAPFYANEPDDRTLRLAFVTVAPERIEQGVQQLRRSLDAISR